MKIFLALIAFSNLVFAQSEYKGNIKGSSLSCTLRIEQVYFIDNIEMIENLRADIVALLEDDHHHISSSEEFFFTVKLGARPNLFSGTGENQKDQINLLVTPGQTGLNSIESYALKWLHGNHFHSSQCVNLKRLEE